VESRECLGVRKKEVKCVWMCVGGGGFYREGGERVNEILCWNSQDFGRFGRFYKDLNDYVLILFDFMIYFN
jgi:hypothetical protein